MESVYLLTLDDMDFLKKNLTEIQTTLDAEGAIPESHAKSTIRQNLDNIKIVCDKVKGQKNE